VILPPKPRLIDAEDIDGTLHDAHQRAVALRVFANSARLADGERAAGLAEADLGARLADNRRQPVGDQRLNLNEVQRDAFRGPWADAGQFAEGGNEVADRFREGGHNVARLDQAWDAEALGHLTHLFVGNFFGLLQRVIRG